MSSLPVGVDPASVHYIAPFCTEDDVPESLSRSVPDVDLAEAIAAATEALYIRSGRVYRYGRSVVRPTTVQSGFSNQSYLYPYSSMSGYGSAWGFAAGWAWTAIGMGWWQNGQDLAEVVLQAPVRRINSVMVDGAVLDPSQYTLYDRRRLVRNVQATGGPQSGAWPWNQSLQLPITSPGTWQIDYEWGQRVPSLGKFACVELAVEIARSVSTADSGRLPERTTSVSSEGVTTLIGDPLAYLERDLTGLPLCDLFLKTVNPYGRRRPAAFIGPNSLQHRAT